MRHLLAGFFGGEIDPLMQGRVDTDNYGFGLATCENFVALAQGPLVKRPGFEMIRDADPSSTWLSPFRFSISQEYVIEWGEGKARFFTNGGRVETAPNVAYELALPFTATEAPALSSQQSYDRLYIDHAAHPPGAIVRTSAVTFAFETLELLNGPFKDENSDQAVTVTASAATGGGVTITASSAIFAPGHVGALFRIGARDFSDMKAWEPGMKDIAAGEIVRSDGKAYVAATAGTTGSITPTHFEGSEWDGLAKKDATNDKGPYGVKWTYRHDSFGIARLTTVADDGLSATADIVRRLPDSVTSVATQRWAHACFSAAEGWPSLVTLWSGRQVHFKDFDVVASVAGDFGGGRVNFASFTASGTRTPDLAFRRALATDDPPLWVTADVRKLLVGTASKELAIGAVNAQAIVSSDNISADPQSFYGSEAVRPAQIGVQTLFVERGGRRLRAAGYDFSRDRYAADDMTAAARHITLTGLVQLAYQRVPWPMLYAVRGDGQLVAHADTKADVKGFTRIVLGGGARALSCASVVGADGKTDELWLLVARDTPGGTRREIWRQTAWRELGDNRAECFFVDGGVRVAAAGGQAHFSELGHLAGQPVAVLADGAVVPGMAVTGGGELTLPGSAVPAWPYVAVIGLAYTATATTLPPEFKLQNGTVQGAIKRVRKLLLRLLETLGIRAGLAGAQLDELDGLDRPASADMDAPIPLFTGDVAGPIDTEFDRSGRVTWTSDVPLPATITAAVLSLEVDQRDA